MTPEDEIESIIHESILSDPDCTSCQLTTFPEIHIARLPSCYAIAILYKHHKNTEVIRRYEKLTISLRASKIFIENRILDKCRKLTIVELNNNNVMVPIYYKDCIFTDKQNLISENCENCIIVRD